MMNKKELAMRGLTIFWMLGTNCNCVAESTKKRKSLYSDEELTLDEFETEVLAAEEERATESPRKRKYKIRSSLAKKLN
uniref:Secreted protein n=1 Tax=Ditylenchus dipsaci TaxID=166011 RepID=A0A915E3R4_9BILA